MPKKMHNIAGISAAALGLILLVMLLYHGIALAVSFREAATMQSEATRMKSRIDALTTETVTTAEPNNSYATISKAGFLGPPMPGAPQPVLTAIIGDIAIVDGGEKRTSDTLNNGAMIVEITGDKVILEQNGNRSELTLFQELKMAPASN